MARGKIDDERIVSRQLGAGVASTGITRDQRSSAYRLFGGYQFNRNFALEAGFFNLGKFQVHSTTAPAGTLDGEVKVQGAALDLVGTLPMTDRFSLLGRVGAQYAKTRDHFSGTGAVVVTNPSPSQRQLNYKVGAGVQYAFSPSFMMRGEAERYRVRDAMDGNANVNVYSVSLVFPFGGQPQARRAMAPTPWVAAAPVKSEPIAVIAAAPEYVAPVPIVVAAPMAPAPRRVSFTAESLFSFDRAVLRPEGMTALDAFARDVSGTQFQVIVVEGHADRIGTDSYNQKLSLERADAVKAYLVTSGGFDAAKISTTGVGESAPVTTVDTCSASLAGAALRACLQPDRRVEVDVTGTR
jgi:OOP family OmpA-OmpF porin